MSIEETHIVANLAEKMAPAFRDKFDFSEDVHFERLSDLSWKCAEALNRKRVSMVAAAIKAEAEEKARKEKEAAK